MQQENSKHGKDIKAAFLELSATPNPATFHGSLSQIFFGIWRQAFSKVLSCSCTKAHGFNLLFFGTLGFFSLFSLFSFVAWGFKIKLLSVLTSLNL
jgi:hypothetical protein